MKPKYLSLLILILAIVGVILISGCIQQTKSVCGNGVIEPGEECDGNGCPTDKICTEKCKCETLTPPPLPG